VLAQAIEVDFLVSVDQVTLATIDALGGRDEACHENVAAVLDRVPPDRDIALSARVALGLLATSHGRFEDAFATLHPIHERVSASGLKEVWRYPYQPNLVEACTRLGRADDARAVLEWFEELAEDAGSRWGLAAAARCRGLLAAAAEIDPAFELALERHEDVRSPFERARTELVYGERLRRANRRKDARPHLRTALEVFDAASATPWSERARAELRATGERLAPREESDIDRLTPQELQIATLVAEGLTNREIGAQIFLSPKTVEYHLTHVYRKLDLHSRAELIRLFSGQSEELEVTSA
jgi:DNA-binding CsgD family transcriptional regulator